MTDHTPRPGAPRPGSDPDRRDPGDVLGDLPDLPDFPDRPPQPDVPAGPDMLADLDPELPLVLFPVRLATRYHRPDPDEDPTELWVRIFPDLVHADGHVLGLTEDEVVIGQSYWERIWRASTDFAARQDAHAWIVNQVDAPRAAWVAERTAPKNPGEAPRRPVPAPDPLLPGPQFGKPLIRTKSTPTRARLLPDRWCVIAREGQEYVRRSWTLPVRRDLAMAPDLTDLPEGGDISDFLRAQDLWWMADFPTAVRAGMGLRLRLPRPMREGIEQLLVFGIRADDATSADELAALLDAQRYSQGIGFLPQGTPTNNTDTVSTPWSDTPTNLEAVLGPIAPPPDDEVPPDKSDRLRRGPAEIGARPPKEPVPSVRDSPAAEALALTLGLEESGALATVEHADVVHTAWARAMNRILWPATVGHLMESMLATDRSGALGEDQEELQESWFRNWVFAPGMLPALRIGNQPYGVLPVVRRRRDRNEPGRWSGLSTLLFDTESDWVAGGDPPHFSPTRLDGPVTPEEEAVRLAAVLGAVPHPTAFRLREALDVRDALTADWDSAVATLEDLLGDVPLEVRTEYYAPDVDQTLRSGSLDDQSSALYNFRPEVALRLDTHPAYEDGLNAVLDHIDDVMLPMVAAHRLRAEARLVGAGFSGATLADDLDPDLWYVDYGADGSAADGTFPEFRLVPDGGPTEVAQTLRDLALAARPGPAVIQFFPHIPAPLLVKLAQQSVQIARTTDGGPLAQALEELADLLEGADPATAMADLERTMRETLGLVTHRWDAFVTSFANSRLSELRSGRPAGVQVGGYGWLTEIIPDEGGNDSDGYIHAPSLDHATTAAILRSSWLAYADEYDDAPFSVDLSSDRVRRAMWLLDGVRNGVDLGELLGARFERRLHDRGMSDLIHDVRLLVPADAVGGEASATTGQSIVDGLALAVAFSESTSDDPVRSAIDGLRATLSGYPNDALLPVLEETVGDLDSTADLLTAQAVHSVAKGNLSEAASVLSLSGAGATSVPDIRMPRVHRESRLVEHRVAAVLPARPAGGRLATIALPSLAAWLDEVLPPLDSVRCRVRFDDGQTWEGSVADLGLRAVDVVSLCSPGSDLSGDRLGAMLVARARFVRGVPSETRGHVVRAGGAPSLHDVAVASGAVRSAIGAARPLGASDLQHGGGTVAEPDVDDLDDRRNALIGRLTEVAEHPGGDALLDDHFADLVTLDPGGLIAALSAGDGERPGLIAALVRRANDAVKLLAAPFDPAAGEDARDPDDQITRIVGALGLALPVLPRFVPGNQPELTDTLGRSDRRLGSPVRPLAWLLETGRVHDGVGRCATMLDLVELVNPGAPTRCSLAQLPDVEAEPWVGLAAPELGRLGILSITDARAALDAGPIAGLLFDAWSEPVPARRATTGVAVHFDRPGAQAPQTILVAVTQSWGTWDVQELEVILGQTLDLARARAMGPETMLAWGHTLPAVYLPPDTAVETVEPAADSVLEAIS